MQVVSLADGAVVTVSHALMAPVGWSADSRTLFLSGGRFLADTYQVLAVPVMGGHATVLGTSPPTWNCSTWLHTVSAPSSSGTRADPTPG